MEFIESYQNYIALGILLNILSSVGFGIYKALNISEEEAFYLISTYEAKVNILKLLAMWCLPFFGFLYVFKEILRLQIYLNRGLSVFDYVEDRIKRESKKS